jgi:hypothetical protein
LADGDSFAKESAQMLMQQLEEPVDAAALEEV